jgi:hypothetical protein
MTGILSNRAGNLRQVELALMLAEFHETAKLTAVFAEYGSVEVLTLLIVNECFDRLAKCGGAVGLYRITDCVIGEFNLSLDPFGAGPRFFLGRTAVLSSVVRPAEMFHQPQLL